MWAFKAHAKTYFGDRKLGGKQSLRLVDSYLREIAMERFAIDGLKEPDKIKFRKMSFARNIG